MSRYQLAIIGGAGPIAGALLLEKVICTYQKRAGCYEDKDFPAIQLLSYPFHDMLGDAADQVALEKDVLQVLESIDADHVVVACNTLHAFCAKRFADYKWLDLLDITASHIKSLNLVKPPLVLCTKNSRIHKSHQSYFDCVYPPEEEQSKIDQIIEAILRGWHTGITAAQLVGFQHNDQHVVLGCTELSILAERFNVFPETFIDPLDCAADYIFDLIPPKK